MTGLAIALALKIDDAEMDIGVIRARGFGTRDAFEPHVAVDADELRRKRQLVPIGFPKGGDQQHADTVGRDVGQRRSREPTTKGHRDLIATPQRLKLRERGARQRENLLK